MVVIRLSRTGAKKSPFYHVVVTDHRTRRDGKCIERIGYFNPVARGQEVRLHLEMNQLNHWEKLGAQLSDRVKSLVKEFNKAASGLVDVHAQEEWIVVGKFGQVHGIKGLIKVISFTEPRENILNYEPWFIKNKTSWQSIEINQALTHTKDILVGVKGYAEREDVAVLTNQEIAVPKSALPLLASDEYYWHELVGMRVIQRDQTELGMVVEIIATGSNDVLIVTSDHGTQRYLIPYLVDEVIIEVSRPKRCITVDWDLDF